MSGFLKLNWKDVGKGFLMVIFTAIVTALYQGLSAVPPHIPVTLVEWQTIGIAAVTAGIAYLVKNLLTNSEGKPLTSEAK